MSGASIRLYSRFVNSAGERVRIALALKEIPYDYVSVRTIGQEAYRRLNPQSLLPALEIDGQIVVQATAILEYLEERWPARPLLPADPILRARARGFAQFITSEMHAIDVIRVRRFLSQKLGVDADGLAHWQRHWFGTGFAALEEILARRETEWPFCFGEAPGWADIHLIPQVRKGLTRFGIDTDASPLIAGIYERCRDHPAFLAAEPRNQPDWTEDNAEPPIDGGLDAGMG
jgi:maleylacetoacetate isomerase